MEQLREWRKLIGLLIPERSADVIEAFAWNAILNRLPILRRDWKVQQSAKKAVLEHLPEFGEVITTRTSFESYNNSKVIETEHGVILFDNDYIRVVGSCKWVDEVSLKIEDLLEQHTKDNVCILSCEHGELDITELPTPVCEPLISDNYTNEALADFEHIINDLAAPRPCGRLVLLSGLPGTGKTFFIRGLIDKISSKVYSIIVPPTLTSKITDPSMINTFMEKAGEKPLVLIAEDADTMLAPREADNIADVSTLLNLTDGLIGQSLDIRVVLTTNTGALKLDKAITRSGRLCRAIEFPLLTLDHAERIARRVGKTLNKYKYPHDFSLAEIYSGQRRLGDRVMGFE